MGQKDMVSFSCEVVGESSLAIIPLVNDVPLTRLVSEFEKTRSYEPVGGYGGIVPQFFTYGPLEKYFMGEHDPESHWAKLGAE
jgi:hypothetical protein